MTALLPILLLLTQSPALPSLDQIRADANAEHRARTAVEFAAAVERNAEAAYSKGDLAVVESELKRMEAAVELARDSFQQTGRTPQRHVGPYKTAELKTQEILNRLGDLEKRMDADERHLVEGPRAKIQEIHDAWFEGIMGKKR
jgi:hypothetical protein